MISTDATLVVRAPAHTPLDAIEQFIGKNTGWIRRTVARIQRRPQVKKKEFISGEEFLFLGKSCPLEVQNDTRQPLHWSDGFIPDFSIEKSASSDSERPQGQTRREFVLLCGVGHVSLVKRYVGTQILRLHKIVPACVAPARKIRDYLASRQNPRRILSCNPFGANFAIAKFGFILDEKERSRGRELFVEWYKKEAKKIIAARVEWWAQRFCLAYQSVHITSANRRWGSCAPNDRLNFSWRLVMAPIAVIDYVVVHELAHITHKNHSRRFWDKVKAMYPDYKEAQAWLRENEGMLNL